MEEMWRMLIRHQLTPNQFYVLHSIKTTIGTPLVNTALEFRILKQKEWILPDGKLSNKAKVVINEVETFFKKTKKKSSEVIMGKGFDGRIDEYNNYWPKMKLPTGKAARSAKGNLEAPFRWFFEKFEYSWDLVMLATIHYLNEKEQQGWHYCRNSQYFIRKQAADKSWESDLADYCQLIEDGDDSQKNYFKDKVF